MQAAASCYIELIVKESDNNVKLIVLDRLIALREAPAHEKILQVLSDHLLHRAVMFYQPLCFLQISFAVESVSGVKYFIFLWTFPISYQSKYIDSARPCLTLPYVWGGCLH